MANEIPARPGLRCAFRLRAGIGGDAVVGDGGRCIGVWTMTPDEMFDAITSLCDGHNVSIRRTAHWTNPKHWYVSAPIEISNGAILTSCPGFADTPQEAIRNVWKRITELAPNEHIYIAGNNTRDAARVRWTGYMFSPIPRDSKP